MMRVKMVVRRQKRRKPGEDVSQVVLVPLTTST